MITGWFELFLNLCPPPDPGKERKKKNKPRAFDLSFPESLVSGRSFLSTFFDQGEKKKRENFFFTKSGNGNPFFTRL